jgi:membrane-associated phospholipid phosphatase
VTSASIKRYLQRCYPLQFLFVQARMAPEGLFGRYLTVGAAMLVGAVWLFGGIAEDVITGEPLVLIDQWLSEWFRAHATPRFTEAMRVVSALASPATVSTLSITMIILLLWQRLWYCLLALALAVVGGLCLNVLLKVLFDRERPGWADAALTDAGFPSGHTMIAAILYGFVAIYLILLIKSWGARCIIALVTINLVLLVALSRLYLGAHFFSDVLAAMAAGMAWLALCLTAVETLRRYRA